jgi:hypothetical protein
LTEKFGLTQASSSLPGANTHLRFGAEISNFPFHLGLLGSDMPDRRQLQRELG